MSIKDNIGINARILRDEIIEWYLEFDEKVRMAFENTLIAIVLLVLLGFAFTLEEPPANDPGYVGGTYYATAEVVDNDGGYVIDGHLFRDSEFEDYAIGTPIGVTMNDGGTIDNHEDDKLAHIGE